MTTKYSDLLTKYPQLFSSAFFGFECGEGWYPLISSLCALLSWDGCNFEKDFVRENPPTIVQIKEKFGTLRFYAHNTTDRDAAMIEFAEYLSGIMCESCGTTKNVSRTTNGWIMTLCQQCATERTI